MAATSDIEQALARCEARLAAHHEIARALSESTTSQTAARGVMQAVGRCLDWRCAFYWRLDDSGVLRVAQHWVGDASLASFVEETAAITFARGHGLPGRVWDAQAPAWIADIT